MTHGNKLYTVEYLPIVVTADIPKLPSAIKARIKEVIEERLTADPVAFGKPLQYSLRGHRRLRVGDYRIVYRIITASRNVVVVAIKHRKDIYD